MDAVDIFKEIIGKRLEPLLVKYNPYTEKYLTYPYRHIFLPDFEPRFANVLFDTIIFYAYEKAEIEKEYSIIICVCYLFYYLYLFKKRNINPKKYFFYKKNIN